MLTDAKIRALKIKDGKRHTDMDGLVLEIRQSGKKVFIFRFQWNKKPQTITLGNYPHIGLADARKIVQSYRTLIAQGIDPRLQHSNEKPTITFKDVAEKWFQKNSHRWKDVTYKRHLKSLHRDIYPFIGNRPIDEITKAELLAIIHPHEIQGHHEVAHRLHDRLKSIFEYATGASITENYPFIGLKKALTPKPKVTNQYAISSHEAHNMLEAIKLSSASKINKLYVELLSHLFTRPSELRLAQWSEFNLQQAEWIIPAERMKMGVTHWVPLSHPVIKLLKELRTITGFTPYLFNSPSTKSYQPISETSARKLLHNIGYKGAHTLHGFRSLASTVLHEQSNFRSDAIEAQLAHKIQGVRGIYLRADFKEERRSLMGWYSNWLSNGLHQDYLVNYKKENSNDHPY
ncbi:integrase [Legionella sainthelensi]|uniref:Integrase n=1 Tax=Legionella sainthelensi TaxID=28087 RepID=A0A0W0YPK4_9GAMM|nr:integrase arm-type DNA-binding domain-containing protein [Legionella sainthelensi]KTD58801.1 integrase [Legionella sainthelensi]VEH34131.1 integrase [Legionella sainthelensi]